MSKRARSSGDERDGGRLRRSFGRWMPAAAKWGVWAVVAAAVAASAVGCTSRESLHPGLRVDDEDLERAIKKGKNLIAAGQDPRQAYAHTMKDVHARVSPDVILRSAGVCWPRDAIAFAIAQGGDKSDEGVKRALQRALKTVEREIMFTAVLQIPKSRDPADVEFALRTNMGVKYPPIVVEAPSFVREVISPFDPSAPVSVMYEYVMRFPVRGGPGVPPIGPSVRSLFLDVTDGDCTGSAQFDLRSR